MKNIRNFLSILTVIAVAVILITIQFNGKSEEKDQNNIANASLSSGAGQAQEEQLFDVSQAKAEEYVDFELTVPESPEGHADPITNVQVPPEGAVSDEDAYRSQTSIETYYPSKSNKEEGIIVTQTNHEVIPMDAATGKELVSKPIKVNGDEINSYDCNCKTPSQKYWWFDGEVTYDIKVIGKVPKGEVYQLIKELKK